MNNKNSHFSSTREETIKWLDKYKIENYTINDDLSVDVNGYVGLYRKNLKTIPVKFNNVTGRFDCGNNKLTSLIGFGLCIRSSEHHIPFFGQITRIC